MKLLKHLVRIPLSSIILLVIFALFSLTVIQGYLLYVQINVQKKAFQFKTNDILLEIHHSVEDDSLASAILINYLWHKEKGKDIDDKLRDNALKLLQHKIDSVSLEFGVDLPFNYAIFHTTGGEFVLSSIDKIKEPEKYYKQSIKAGWRIKGTLGEGKYRIGINFKNEFLYFLQQTKFILVISIILISLLSFSFYVVISSWRRQKQLAELKNDFINNLTHELKTPIFSVSLLHNVIDKMNGETPAKVKKYLRLLQNENQKLKERVEKVLDITLMENESLPLDFEKTDVHQLIREACQLIEFLLEQQNGTIKYDFQASNSYCLVDKVHYKGIIHNLVDNARKYTPEPAQIEIYSKNQDQKIIIGVRDNGIGIEKSQIEKIFDKFYRVPTGDLHKVKGLGLGLSYVKMMLEAHHGKIWIQSKYMQGSEFIIEMPNSDKDETKNITS